MKGVSPAGPWKEKAPDSRSKGPGTRGRVSRRGQEIKQKEMKKAAAMKTPLILL